MIHTVTKDSDSWFIVCNCPKEIDKEATLHCHELSRIAINILKAEKKDCEIGLTTWKIKAQDLTSVFKVTERLLKEHTYLHERQLGVELYAMRGSENSPQVIKLGARPPTSDHLKTCEEVYFKQYLPDHSLYSTRLIHTIATLIGVAGAAYGVFYGHWISIPLGIGIIYESGFHSHLFAEKNIPSSTKYPLQSIYCDLRVTFQMLTNTVTGGMDKDLAKAGIYDVTKPVVIVNN